MPFDQFSRYDSHLGNGQSQLLQDVKKILQQRYTTTDGMRGDGQVAVVPFKGGHTVELLPAWKLTSGKYYVPNTHDGGSWKTVDHNAEIGNVDNSDNNSKGNTRDLIRMMKIWQAECRVPIKSLTLELRTVNFLKSWPHRGNSTMYYDWMVRDFFSELVKNANNYCVIPGIDERCYYGDTWLSRAESAHGRALKACDYESSGKHYAAVAEWQKIFESQFDY